MPLLFVDSTGLPCVPGKKVEPHGSRLTCSISNPRSSAPEKFSLRRNHVTGAKSSKLLTLSDHVVLGPSQENPHAAESNRITKQICKEFYACDPGFVKYDTMTAFIYPRTSKDRLTALNLFFCLLYFIDDELERSLPREYAKDPQGIRRVLETVVGVLCDAYEPKDEHILHALCREINTRLTPLCDTEWMRRLRDSLHEHMREALDMRNLDTSVHISVDDYMAWRLSDSGMEPAVDCIEIAWDINVPDEILQHEHIREMAHCTKRIGWLSNDVFSYKKEVIDLGLRLNFLNIIMENYNLSLQEAVHEAISMVNSDSMRFVELENNLPVWEDAEFDRIAQCYVQGMRDLIIATYHWQMSTNRYRSPSNPFPELRKLL